jgi:hypothetical protein
MQHIMDIPVQDKQIVVSLSKAELDYLAQLIDLGVKAGGLQAVKPDLIVVMQKFTSAIQQANAPQELSDGHTS